MYIISFNICPYLAFKFSNWTVRDFYATEKFANYLSLCYKGSMIGPAEVPVVDMHALLEQK